MEIKQYAQLAIINMGIEEVKDSTADSIKIRNNIQVIFLRLLVQAEKKRTFESFQCSKKKVPRKTG